MIQKKIISKDNIKDLISNNPNCLNFTAIYKCHSLNKIQIFSDLSKIGCTTAQIDKLRSNWNTSVESCMIWINDELMDLSDINDKNADTFWTNFFYCGFYKGKKRFLKNKLYQIKIIINFKYPVKSFSRLFSYNNDLIEMVKINNSRDITDTLGMFKYCLNLEKVCLFDTKSVLDSSKMFMSTAIKTIPDGFNWKKLLFCDFMFANCLDLEGPLPPFNKTTAPYIVKSAVKGFFKNVNFSWWKQYNQGFK